MRCLHDVTHAHYPTLSHDGWWVYLRCGDCNALFKVAISVWESAMHIKDGWTALGKPTTHAR